MRAWRIAQRSLVNLVPRSNRAFSCSRVLFERRSVAHILQHGKDAENVSVTGWVRSVRKQKKVGFAAVGDGSTVDSLQAVLKPEDAIEYVTIVAQTSLSRLIRPTDCLLAQR